MGLLRCLIQRQGRHQHAPSMINNVSIAWEQAPRCLKFRIRIRMLSMVGEFWECVSRYA